MDDNDSYDRRSSYGRDRDRGSQSYERRSYEGGGRRGRGRDGYRGPSYRQESQMKKVQYDEDEEIKMKLRSLIVRVGDKSSSSLESNIDGLANAFEGDLQQPTRKAGIIECLLQCVRALAVRIPVYGTLVGLLNVLNPEFGKEMVEQTTAVLQEALNTNRCDEIRFLTQFIGELVNANVVVPNAIVELLNQYLEVAASNISSNDPDQKLEQERSDFFLMVVMQTIPLIAKELNERKKEELSKIFTSIESLVSKRTSKASSVLQVFDDVVPSDDSWSMWWKALVQLKSSKYELLATLKPYADLESKLNNSNAYTLPNSITIPAHKPGFTYSKWNLFRLYETDDLKLIDRMMTEQYIVDILFYFEAEHKDCAKQLESLPFDINYDQLLVETLFSQLFMLPVPPFKQVYYVVVLTALCKSKPQLFPYLGQAIETFFERLDTIDVECVDRFTSWFSHHLSNFDFKWIWSNWDSVLPHQVNGEPSPTAPSVSQKRIWFIKDILDKTMRLAYYERVKKTLPDEFHDLMCEKPVPIYRYDAESTKYVNESNLLLEKLRSKESVDSIVSTLLENDSLVFNPSLDEKIDLIVQCVLKIGSKSFSHLLASLERYLPLLKRYVTDQETKVLLLKSVHQFWQKSAQQVTILVDRLMAYKIVDCVSVINHVFSYGNGLPQFEKYYIRDILRNAIERIVSRMEPIREELKTAKEALEKVPQEERNEDIPEAKRVKDREATLATMQQEQKELFLVFYQKLCMAMAEHANQCSVNNTDPSTTIWYFYTTQMFKEISRKHHSEIKPFSSTLESLVFNNIDPKLSVIFQQVKEI